MMTLAWLFVFAYRFPPVGGINAGIPASVHLINEQELERYAAFPALVF